MKSQKEQNKWKEVRYSRRFVHAWHGIRLFLKTSSHNFAILFFSLVTISLGFYFRISIPEWASVVFAIGIIIISEIFNSAIEVSTDLASPEFHPFARDTKDLAAGAVLMAVIFSGIVGAIIFVPKIIAVIYCIYV